MTSWPAAPCAMTEPLSSRKLEDRCAEEWTLRSSGQSGAFPVSNDVGLGILFGRVYIMLSAI